MTTNPETVHAATRPSKMVRASQPRAIGRNVPLAQCGSHARETPVKHLSKTKLVLGLLARDEGATIEQMATATGWLPHTTRAALTGLRKKGHAVTSEKVGGLERVYRVGIS